MHNKQINKNYKQNYSLPEASDLLTVFSSPVAFISCFLGPGYLSSGLWVSGESPGEPPSSPACTCTHTHCPLQSDLYFTFSSLHSQALLPSGCHHNTELF